jgi:anti-sigma28 factor (negative regulator of flagellin synthesis)
MRIDPKVVISPVTRDAREAASTAKSGEPATSASVVKLSAAGMTASAEAAASPTTTSRLQTIRAMLDKGDYPVDLDLLAHRIVDDEVLRVGRS